MTGVVLQSGPTVALVGLGRVGAQAPAVWSDAGDVFRNHLDAAQVASGRIAALVDPSAERRREARQRCPQQQAIVEADDIEALKPGSADVVAIATPPSDRKRLLKAAFAMGPKAIVVEKPLADNLEAARELMRMAAAARTPMFVAYNRRTDPGMRAFANDIAGQPLRRAVFYYANGLLNYASHVVDSILQWFGPVQFVQALPDGAGDPDAGSVSFRCRTVTGLSVDVIGLTGVRYDVFEADIFLADGRIGYRNNGAEKFRYRLCDDLYYPGYAGLVEQPAGKPRAIGGFVEMYRLLFESIESGKPAELLCAVTQAFEVQRVLTAVMRSAAEQGRIVSLDHGNSKS